MVAASSAIRRSTRERKKTVSYYDDVAVDSGRKSRSSTTPTRTGTRGRDDDDDDEASKTSSQNSDDQDDGMDTSSDAEEPAKPKRVTPAKTKSPRQGAGDAAAAKKKAPGSTKKKTAGESKKGKGSKKDNAGGAGGVVPKNPSRPQAFKALETLAKKAFPDGENDDSLAHRLIQVTANNDDNNNKKKRKNNDGSSSSIYTEAIQALVHQVLHEDDRVDVVLLNLIWRSIGATTLLSADIDDWTDDDWVENVERAVKEMEESDQTLLAVKGRPNLGTAEFLKLYTEFWFILAQTAPVATLEKVLARLMELQAASVVDMRWAICLAVYAVGEGALELVQDLRRKVTTADRQYKAAKRTKSDRKSGVLKAQLDDWQTKIVELSNIVKENVMVVFIGRYRDAEESIRVLSIDFIGRCVKMNEEFASSYYFKYVGWMLSDLSVSVRIAALRAIKAPFQVDGLDWKGMTSVISRYTARIVECTQDVDSIVQEAAMDLLLVLFQNDLLDETKTEMWTHLNSKALATYGTPKFRRDALYLVLGQLSEFDDGSFKSERHAAEQISQLSQWLALEIQPVAQAADELDDDEQQPKANAVDRVDLIVESLRQMPEHKKLVTNWSAYLRFLHEEERRQTDDRNLDTLKQAVVLRMLSKAAETAKPDELDDLTLTMLRVLPELLSSYKSETAVLQNLTSLPRYFCPKAVGVPTRRKEFKSILQTLSDIFRETSDVVLAKSCCQSLAFLAEADQARRDDAVLCLKDTASTIRKDLSRSISNSDDHEKTRHCLQRLSMLSRRCDLGALLEANEDDPIELLSQTIFDFVEAHLKVRKIEALNDEDGTGDDDAKEVTVPPIWSTADPESHADVAQSICYVFDIFTSLMGWTLSKHIAMIAEGNEPNFADIELSENMAVRLRARTLNATTLCFDSCPSGEQFDDWEYSQAQSRFLHIIRHRSLKAYCDVCMLFPSNWSDAKSAFLQACAWNPMNSLPRAAASNFKHSVEDGESSREIVEDVLLPFVRSVLCTQTRSDVSRALHYVSGYGKEAQELVLQLIKALNKTKFSRVLEAEITYLQMEFENWGESEPDEPDDCPTDSQLTEHDAEVDEWDKAFQLLLAKAAKLSTSKGNGGHLAGAKRAQMLKFMQEGLCFAFRRDNGEEGEAAEILHLGVRLPFLFLLAKYGRHIKNHEASSLIIERDLNQREAKFRGDDEFRELAPEGREMEALAEFRRACGFGKFSAERKSVARKRLSLAKPRMSTGSSVSSIQSKRSKESSLDAIEEEDEETKGAGFALTSPESQGSVSASSSRMPRGFAQGSVASTLNATTVDEDDDDEDDGSEETGAVSKLKSIHDEEETVATNIASPESKNGSPQGKKASRKSAEDDDETVASPESKSALRKGKKASRKSAKDDDEAVASPLGKNAFRQGKKASRKSAKDDGDETAASPHSTADKKGGRSVAPSQRRSTMMSEATTIASGGSRRSRDDVTNAASSVRASGNTLGSPTSRNNDDDSSDAASSVADKTNDASSARPSRNSLGSPTSRNNNADDDDSSVAASSDEEEEEETNAASSVKPSGNTVATPTSRNDADDSDDDTMDST